MSDVAPEIRADTVEVRFDPEAGRFDALHQGQPTGAHLLADRDEQGLWDLRSTQVPSRMEGRGIAGALVRAALERVAETEGDSVRPTCSYVTTWLERHPEWQAYVHPQYRGWLRPRDRKGGGTAG